MNEQYDEGICIDYNSKPHTLASRRWCLSWAMGMKSRRETAVSGYQCRTAGSYVLASSEGQPSFDTAMEV